MGFCGDFPRCKPSLFIMYVNGCTMKYNFVQFSRIVDLQIYLRFYPISKKLNCQVVGGPINSLARIFFSLPYTTTTPTDSQFFRIHIKFPQSLIFSYNLCNVNIAANFGNIWKFSSRKIITIKFFVYFIFLFWH